MNRARSACPGGPLKRMLALLTATLLLAGAAVAAELAGPKGPVLLSVTGKIGKTNDGNAALFDEDMLSALPRHRIVTSTPWTDGIKHFEGFLLKDLLEEVAAAGSVLRAEGINGYRIEFPISDADEFGVLIAMRMDEKPLSRRDKGPLWIVYPRDSVPAAQDERYDHRWVWQLGKLEVR